MAKQIKMDVFVGGVYVCSSMRFLRVRDYRDYLFAQRGVEVPQIGGGKKFVGINTGVKVTVKKG